MEGTFGGKWLKRVEIQKAVLEDPVELEDNVLPGSVKELQYVCIGVGTGTSAPPPNQFSTYLLGCMFLLSIYVHI